MSGPDRPVPLEGVSEPTDAAPAAVAPDPGPAPSRPGSRRFTIEGRAAPGLFVAGWLATILGGVITFVGLAGEASVARAGLLLIGLVLLAAGLVAGAGSQAIERRARDEPFRGPSPFLAFVASVPLTLAITNIAFLPLVLLDVDPTSPVAVLVQVVITALVYYILVRLLVVDLGALTWAEMGIGRLDRQAARSFGRGALYAVPAILVTAIVALLASTVLPIPPPPLPIRPDPVGAVSALLAAGVVAPIGEELFFRGYATTAWARGTGTRRALIQGSLFFAFVHILGVTGETAAIATGAAVSAFLGRLPIAFMLGYVFLRTRSLWASTGLHATFNTVLVLLALAAGGLEQPLG